MKLHELASAPGNDFKRLYMLKRMLEIGDQPEIGNASYVRGHFSWGDLEKLGFAEHKHQKTAYGMEYWWTYTGPGAIVVVTTARDGERKDVIRSGESTEPVEVSYPDER